MDKEESYGRPNLFVYCKDTCDPRGLYYAKNEVDKVIDDMMAEARTDNSAVIDKLLDERRWRKFSEEKPDDKQWILVFHPKHSRFKSDVELRRWDIGCKFDVENQELYTLWIPLPSAPKEV